MKMSREEFERQCADHLGVCVDELGQRGEFTVRCKCPCKYCCGWVMLNATVARWALASGNVAFEDLPGLFRLMLYG